MVDQAGILPLNRRNHSVGGCRRQRTNIILRQAVLFGYPRSPRFPAPEQL